MSSSREEQYAALSQAISRVVTPVMVCMALAVWFVHSLGDIDKCNPLKAPQVLDDIALYPVPGANASASATYSTGITVIFIVGILVLMVLLTFLIVWLYKSGKQIFIKVWLMLAVFLIFSYVGGLYIFDFCRSRCIPLDWISLVLAVWNFTITGMYAVFGRVPRLINQAYLIVMSALMSYIFRSLPGYAVWIILAALVVWDLFAVLSRFGPLRMLVEAARTQGDELPALVYDTNPVAAGREPAMSRPAKASSLQQTKPRPARQSPRTSHTPMSTAAVPTNVTPISVPPPVPENGELPPAPATIAPAPDATPASDAPDARPRRHRLPLSLLRKGRKSAAAAAPASNLNAPDDTIAREGEADVENGGVEGGGGSGGGQETGTATSGGTGRRAQGQRTEGAIQVGTLGTHLKLGLGDFVFYSLLVSQASKAGTMTAVVSFVAVLAGLCATLFLVTVYRKALPALPISIMAGLVFYVLTRFTVQPFTDNLVPELLFH